MSLQTPETPSSIVFSFVIPVYNTGTLLLEALQSVANQNFDLSKVEVVIVDDASSDPQTHNILKQIQSQQVFPELNIHVIVNATNMWSAQARNIGVKHSRGAYLVCLDSDDSIEPNFLYFSYLTLLAHPNASWVYPGVRKFGYRNKIDIPDDFSAKKLFLQNYIVITSPLKRDLWIELKGQQTPTLNNKLKLYEDWDFWLRALRKGYYGVPIKAPVFNYRQGMKSNMSRTEEEGILTTLFAYRQNWMSLFGIPKAQNKYDQINKQYVDDFDFFTRLFRSFMGKFFNRKPQYIRFYDLINFVFAPSRLVKNRLGAQNSFTKAHKMAGFFRAGAKPHRIPQEILDVNQGTFMFAHYWWHVGGAENVLLDYVKEVRPHASRLIDVVVDSKGPASKIKERFASVADLSVSLDVLAKGSYTQLNVLWEMILYEKPERIINMSNPFIYILAPYIKQVLPDIKIYDLLHCEDFEDNGWFEAAYHFQQYVDTRLVISEFWKEVLVQKYNEDPHKIQVVYNMIDYESFEREKGEKQALIESFNIPQSKKIIGFLGRFHEQKRPEIFVGLAEEMESFSDFHFVMIGEGPMLKELLPRMNALSNLTYLGPTKAPQKWYPLFDVAVFPSKYEGYPLVGIECAFLNIPMIAADIVGFNEIVSRGNVGLLYQVRSEQEDIESIKKILLKQYNELLLLGKNGTRFIHEYHNPEVIKPLIQNILVSPTSK